MLADRDLRHVLPSVLRTNWCVDLISDCLEHQNEAAEDYKLRDQHTLCLSGLYNSSQLLTQGQCGTESYDDLRIDPLRHRSTARGNRASLNMGKI